MNDKQAPEQHEDDPQVVHISKNTDRVFSFKKMAFAWIGVILAIVVLSITVEVLVHGW